MCGICGFMYFGDGPRAEESRSVLLRMMGQLVHRGPDDSGWWSDPTVGLFIGHTRLAVVDLSPEGHQPMLSACGRYLIAFNGEIYNFRALRAELESCGAAIAWRGHSDTEVMLAAIAHWGLSDALRRFNGMFAFALWDRHERALHLVRDRVGEKPLYYGWMGGCLLFGSQLKALEEHPSWRGQVDRGALSLFVRHGYVPGQQSIYEGIRKVPPGTAITIRGTRPEWPVPASYWSLRQIAEQSSTRRPIRDVALAEQELHDLLLDVVSLRMEADVPLGAFLSGGIDSSTVVALMQAQSHRPVRTFSIGFEEAAYDEAGHARAVAAHLGTNHTELTVTAREALDVVPRLPLIYDEPFADPSQIPTLLVSTLARRSVTVALSGDAGDELFAGYDRYQKASRIWKSVVWLPPGARRWMAGMLDPLVLLAGRNAQSAQGVRRRQVAGTLTKVAGVLRASSRELLYKRLTTNWSEPNEEPVIHRQDAGDRLPESAAGVAVPDFLHHMMYQDTLGYLPDDILVKVDRASMAVSLEARVPLLDHRLIELAWHLPSRMLVRARTTKWLLRQVLYKYVPRALVERPKMGFGAPVGAWLRGPLRDWAEDLLSESNIRAAGFLDAVSVRRIWLEHLAGREDWQYRLWPIVTFQAWLATRSH